MRKRLFPVLLLGLCAVSASAACPGCVSKGVKITMKSGAVKTGYVPWSPRAYQAFFGSYGRRFDPAVRPLLKERGWSLKKKAASQESFERWLDILNYAFINETVKDSRFIEPFRLYTRLERIRYPFVRYLGVEGEVQTVDPEAVSEISAASELPLSASMSGIAVLPMTSIRRLQTEKPRFVIEHKHAVSGDVYAVYGDVSRRQVLDHIFNRNDGILDSIEVDSEPLDDCAEPACTGFMTMREAYATDRRAQLESCRAPGRELYTKMRRLSRSDPHRAELKKQAYMVFAHCKRLETEVLERHALSLGDAAALRKAGVIVFSYAWN